MKKYIILILVISIFGSCKKKDMPWKDIEIVDVCSFSLPKVLQCADDNEFVKNVEINQETNYCKVDLDETKNSMKQTLVFKSEKMRYMPFWVKVTIENREDCSYRYPETVMEVSDRVIPFLENNLLESYLEFENIDEKEKKKFDWMPIRIVEKDRMRYLVVEYKMPDENKGITLRVVHSIFQFNEKRVVFSIYCNDKKVQISENNYIRFIESISFSNLKVVNHNVYSDINTRYIFDYPKGFKLTEEIEDYSTYEHGHNIKMESDGVTINVRLLQKILDEKTIKESMNHLRTNLKHDRFTTLKRYGTDILGEETFYVDFKYNDGKEKFYGRGYFVKNTSMLISCIIKEKKYESKAKEAMKMITESMTPQDCTYCCYKP